MAGIDRAAGVARTDVGLRSCDVRKRGVFDRTKFSQDLRAVELQVGIIWRQRQHGVEVAPSLFQVALVLRHLNEFKVQLDRTRRLFELGVTFRQRANDFGHRIEFVY